MAVNPVNSSTAKGIFDHPMENGQFAKSEEENVPMGQKNFGILAAQFWFNIVSFVSFLADFVFTRLSVKGTGKNEIKFGRQKIWPLGIYFWSHVFLILGNGLLIGIWMLILNQVQFTNAKSRSPDYVTQHVIKIDDQINHDANLGETCANLDRKFYIEFDTNNMTEMTEIYLCYLSHFNGDYDQENGIQIINPFKFNNTENYKTKNILDFCQYNRTKEEYGQNSAGADKKVKALRGVKFMKNGTKLVVTNSFSNETFAFDLDDKISSKKFRIKFGDLFLELSNGEFNINWNGTKGMKVPPSNALSSFHKMQQAFLANPGIWMIPLDMAFVRDENDKKSRRFHLAIKNDQKKISTEIGYANVENKQTNPIQWNDIPSVLSNGKFSCGIQKPNSKQFCKTEEIFVLPAIIRDRFLELMNTTKCFKQNKTDCPFSEEIDYAVRVGCLDCDIKCSWINELFLDALSDWIESKDGEILQQWSTEKMDLLEFRNEKDKEKQPIDLIENGKYIYFPVPKEWIKYGVKMLAHDCGDYGIFVSAFKNETMKDDELDKIDPIYDWQTDFEFLENCIFLRDEVKSTTYKIQDDNRINLHYVPIGFGTHKIVEENGQKKQVPAKLDEEQILRIKFKYDMNYDMDKFMRRDNKFVTEKDYIEERITYWGHYFVPVEMMFEQFKKSEFNVFGFLAVTKQLRNGPVISEDYFKKTEVKAIIYRMVQRCGDFKIYSTRMWSEQELTFGVAGEFEKKKWINQFQTRTYQNNDGPICYPTKSEQNDLDYNPFLYKYACK